MFKTAIWVSMLDGGLLTLCPGICCESLLRCRKRFRTQATVVTKLRTWEHTEGSLRKGHNTAGKIPSVLASAALKMYGGGPFWESLWRGLLDTGVRNINPKLDVRILSGASPELRNLLSAAASYVVLPRQGSLHSMCSMLLLPG